MPDHLNWSAVVSYCELGIKVFPLVYRKKTPLFETNWVTIATNDVVKARALFPLDNQWNIGITFGPESNVCDIEFDDENSFKALQDAFSVFGEPKTVAYRSDRGIHRLFRWSARLGQFGKAVLKWSGIECRLGTKDVAAYSVAPPSLHPSGQYYDWLPGQAPWEVPILELPSWLEELYAGAQDKFESRSAVGVSRQGDDLCPESGQRHDYLIGFGNLLAGSLRMPHELANEILLTAAEYFGKVADNGLEATQKEVRDIVRTAKRSSLPHEDFPSLDFESMREQAKNLVANLREDRIYARPVVGIPSHIFPPFFEKYAQEAHKAGYSKDLVLMSMLGSVSAALGNSIRVRYAPNAPPTGVQTYSLGVAGASTGKSLVVNHMASPICKGDAYCTNTTPEALVSAMYKNPRGVLLKATEGSSLPAMLGRYAQNGTEGEVDNSVLLQAWSGEQMRVIRKSGDIEIEAPFLSIVAATQPYGLQLFGIQATMDGYMQRTFIYDSPPIPDEVDEDALDFIAKAFQEYAELIDRLKTIRQVQGVPIASIKAIPGVPPVMSPFQCVQPCQFILDREAFACWKAYRKSKRSAKALAEFPEGHPFQSDMLRHAEKGLRTSACFHAADLGLDRLRWEASQIQVLPQIWIPIGPLQRALDLVEHCWERKQELMTDIADDRFNKVNPLGSVRAIESLPIYLDKFVIQRRKKLEKSLRSGDPWSLRDYYRHLHLMQPVAEAEVETMIRTGHVAHAGVRNKTNVFSFVDRETPS